MDFPWWTTFFERQTDSEANFVQRIPSEMCRFLSKCTFVCVRGPHERATRMAGVSLKLRRMVGGNWKLPFSMATSFVDSLRCQLFKLAAVWSRKIEVNSTVSTRFESK